MREMGFRMLRKVNATCLLLALALLVACTDGGGPFEEDFSNTGAFDHNMVVGEACFTCHNNINAQGKTQYHISTTNECQFCHTTSVWIPVIIVDHDQVLGSCYDCHNGYVAQGKLISHIPSTNICETCHSTRSWLPVLQVDHTQVIGTCVGCHNNLLAQGKSFTHINSTDVCDACHEPYPSHWTPVLPGSVDHTQVLGTCSSCHDSVLASGKSANHIVTSLDCGVCHLTTGWLPVTTP